MPVTTVELAPAPLAPPIQSGRDVIRGVRSARVRSDRTAHGNVPAAELSTRRRARERAEPLLPRTVAVPRRALLDLLGSGLGEVVAVSAPAGYGKSTLLSQWAAHDPRPFAWLRVDETDNDAAVLVRRCAAAIAALPSTEPTRKGTRDVADHPVSTPDLEAQVSGLAGPVVIVLDDAHHLTSPAARRVVDLLLHGLPAGSQLAISSRDGGRLLLARWRAEYRVIDIGAEHLAFDQSETRSALGPDVAGGYATALHALCEGWPAAVSLAASDAPPPFHGPLAEAQVEPMRRVQDYVESEVLSGLTPSQLTFLINTSILEELTEGVCDAVSGQPGSGRLLRALHVGPALLVRLPGEVPRYRFRRLLRQALLAELRRGESELIAALHERAAHWYAGAGDIDAAIGHATLAENMDCLGQLVWPHVDPCLDDGAVRRLQGWLGKLSDEQISRSPELTVAAAWAALLGGDLARATRWQSLAQAREGVDWLQHLAGSERRGALALLLAWRGRGGVSRALELSSASYDQLPSDSRWRPAAGMLSGVALATIGQPTEAGERLQDAAELADGLDLPGLRAECLLILRTVQSPPSPGQSSVEQTSPSQALVTASDAPRSPTAAYATSLVAEALARRGRHGDATRILDRARTATDAMADWAPWFQVQARLAQAGTSVILGDLIGARRLVRRARQLVATQPAEPGLSGLVGRVERTIDALPADSGLGSSPLTAAERRILHLLPTCLSFGDIGERLSVSKHTVKSQAMAVYHKLGVVSRNQAVDRAVALGYFEHQTAWTAEASPVGRR